MRACDIQLVRPEQVMQILGLDESGLLGLVNAGQLPAYRIGDAIRFRATEVAALVASQRR